jgi:hypothetical protein
MKETPTTKWWSGTMLLLAAAALAQVDCSSSSTRSPGTGGAGPGTGGTGSGTGGATGVGGSLPGECDGSYEPSGDLCLDAELKWYACCAADDFPVCDSANPADACVASCFQVVTCADLLSLQEDTWTDPITTCFLGCGLDEDTFYCHEGVETISWDYVCDGYEDCPDGSDEFDTYCAA